MDVVCSKLEKYTLLLMQIQSTDLRVFSIPNRNIQCVCILPANQSRCAGQYFSGIRADLSIVFNFVARLVIVPED